MIEIRYFNYWMRKKNNFQDINDLVYICIWYYNWWFSYL